MEETANQKNNLLKTLKSSLKLYLCYYSRVYIIEKEPLLGYRRLCVPPDQGRPCWKGYSTSAALAQ